MSTSETSLASAAGGGRVTLSNGLAWLSLLLALLFPLGLLFSAGVLLLRFGVAYPLAFLYNVVDYYGLPVVVLAIVLGHLSQLAAIRLPSPPVKRRLTRTSLWIGYLSLVFISGAFAVAFAVSTHGSSEQENALHMLLPAFWAQ